MARAADIKGAKDISLIRLRGDCPWFRLKILKSFIVTIIFDLR
jgi:spore coat polysaccharide biosynthesis protein SpsF (cytidylyltransferase family)